MQNQEQTKNFESNAIVDAKSESTLTMSQSEYDELSYWADRGQKQTSFWADALKNPEGTTALKEGIKEVTESVLISQGKIQKDRLKYSSIRIFIVVSLLVVIIAAASWLTSINRLDGSSLIFLLGTITGYLLTFLTKIEHV
ncbi:MAG: hypothetical protein M8353_09905 [ANME-2 cluster archaeon]|nr:hypothetical protein [ANME-2 cluster archaeon]MDW7776848.1 hypothetical protein [Methanosarcinales archaeon]